MIVTSHGLARYIRDRFPQDRLIHSLTHFNMEPAYDFEHEGLYDVFVLRPHLNYREKVLQERLAKLGPDRIERLVNETRFRERSIRSGSLSSRPRRLPRRACVPKSARPEETLSRSGDLSRVGLLSDEEMRGSLRSDPCRARSAIDSRTAARRQVSGAKPSRWSARVPKLLSSPPRSTRRSR